MARKFTLPCKILVPPDNLHVMNVMQTTLPAVTSKIRLTRCEKLRLRGKKIKYETVLPRDAVHQTMLILI